MSGLVVLMSRDGSPVSTELLVGLTGAFSVRGPDGSDHAIRDWVGLAHQHFWTTPEEEGERQPLADPGGRFLLVFDGRLDNREDLVGELRSTAVGDAGASDAALVLAAYQRWGDDFCGHLVGPFAVVIADLECREILCARDPLGDRSIFFHLTDRRFVVASEESVLIAHPEIDSALDDTRLACFFALQVPDNGSTFFREVQELQPGELLQVGEESSRRRRFWQPSAEPSLFGRAEADLAEEFRGLLSQAVRCRLRAAEPPAVMLSGGLDSSSVAAVGAAAIEQDHLDWQLRAISWVFDEIPECDERSFIDPVVDRWHLEKWQVLGDDALPLSHQEGLCLDPGTPEDNPYRELKRRVFSQAAEVGSRVVLNCAMADALYTGGDSWLQDLARSDSPIKAAEEFLAEVARHGPRRAMRGTPALRWAASVKRRVTPRGQSMLSWLTPEAADLVAAVTSPRFAALEGLRRGQLEAVAGWRAARSYSLENRYGARQGIELRDPYRDLRLVEFMLRLPAHQLYRHGRHKHIARQAMTGWVPEPILARTGSTLLTPLFARGLRSENRALAVDLLRSPRALWRPHLRPGWLESALQESLGPAADVVLWSCLSLELWRRRWGSTASPGVLQ